MKPSIQTDKNITSTLEGKRITMDFDPASLAHLQELFINAYKDREMAVLREYACNARDSHVDAGNPDPIEITLPTMFDPVLKIVDYGVGLSLEDLEMIYSRYGASTKRETNAAVGMFGIGCKSALTYTDQFTIRTRKDGLEVIVSVSRNSDGIGELTIVNDDGTEGFQGEPTDERNGVEITIPCPSYTTFAAKAEDLFQYWPEGSVLVDGEEPRRFNQSDEVVHLIDDIYLDSSIKNRYSSKKSVVVQGGVPYPVELDDLGLEFQASGNDYRYDNVLHRVIAFVPVGTVEPVPSREALTNKPGSNTAKALLSIGAQIKDNIDIKIKEEIDKAEGKIAAIRVVEEVKLHYPRVFWPKEWSHRGEVIPKTVDATTAIEVSERDENGYAKTSKGGFVIVRERDSGKAHNRSKNIGWVHVTDCLYFTGFDLDRFTVGHRRRLDQWLENQSDAGANLYRIFYVLTETLPDSDLIDRTMVFDWEDVRTTKVPTQRASSSLGGAYEQIFLGSDHPALTQADAIDSNKPIFFFCELETPMNERNRWRVKSRAQLAKPYVSAVLIKHPDAQIFAFPPNRRAKFERLFPQARELRDELRREAHAWADSLTKRQRKLMAVHLQDSRSYKALEPIRGKIHDPDLRNHIQLAATDVTDLNVEFTKYQNLVVNFHDILKLDPVDEVIDRYPLVRGLQGDSDHLDHATLYINAVYQKLSPTPTNSNN